MNCVYCGSYTDDTGICVNQCAQIALKKALNGPIVVKNRDELVLAEIRDLLRESVRLLGREKIACKKCSGLPGNMNCGQCRGIGTFMIDRRHV